jgi:hypothetical protein
VQYKALFMFFCREVKNAAEMAEHMAGGQNVACFSAGERKVATKSLK